MMGWEVGMFAVVVTAVAVGCLMPTHWLPPLPHDKWLHFGAYGGLTLLAVQIAPGWSQLKFWLLGLLVAGWLIELLQMLVPGRNFCWRDMGANAAGIVTAATAAMLLRTVL
ncbi:VanZ family protein [Pseudoduganella chitinolytica]|uniref:VanZ family protein n=1 Tax=Pseudoduganella chitinolytica TaxID=34070 RepID=A0ABY8BF64_9BURK|nr:VanZ family protein [Pseudoduganella chitinolytica]WEF32934.1 VanZ family protein [Pseudoduganella chitinolytica]